MKRFTQRKDGRYGTKVWDGTYRNGKKHYISLMANTCRELEQKIFEIEKGRADGSLVVASGVTLLDYAVRWLRINKSVREKSTQAMYERIIYKKLGDLGSVPLESLSFSAIQGAINEMYQTPRTCQMFILTLRQILQDAEMDRLIASGMTDRLTKKLSLPRYEKKERRVLTDYEIEAIRSADFTPRERALVFLLYGCGIRKEEALALTRFDVNFKNGTVSINKALGFYKNDGYLKGTKSKNGVRVLPLPPYALEALQGYISILKSTELFPRPFDGSGYITKSIYRREWDRIIKKLEEAYLSTHPALFTDWDSVGIRDLTAHIFRHNYCTRLCYESIKTGAISTKKIAELLGDTEAMVLRVYSHILEENEKPEESVKNALVL